MKATPQRCLHSRAERSRSFSAFLLSFQKTQQRISNCTQWAIPHLISANLGEGDDSYHHISSVEGGDEGGRCCCYCRRRVSVATVQSIVASTALLYRRRWWTDALVALSAASDRCTKGFVCFSFALVYFQPFSLFLFRGSYQKCVTLCVFRRDIIDCLTLRFRCLQLSALTSPDLSWSICIDHRRATHFGQVTKQKQF